MGLGLGGSPALPLGTGGIGSANPPLYVLIVDKTNPDSHWVNNILPPEDVYRNPANTQVFKINPPTILFRLNLATINTIFLDDDTTIYATVYALGDRNIINGYYSGPASLPSRAVTFKKIDVLSLGFKAADPILLSAVPIAGGKVEVKFRYRPGPVSSGGNPDSFSIRVDGIHDTTVNFVTGKSEYEGETTALSETIGQLITVVAIAGTVESISNAIAVTPDATAPSPVSDCTAVLLEQVEI